MFFIQSEIKCWERECLYSALGRDSGDRLVGAEHARARGHVLHFGIIHLRWYLTKTKKTLFVVNVFTFLPASCQVPSIAYAAFAWSLMTGLPIMLDS